MRELSLFFVLVLGLTGSACWTGVDGTAPGPIERRHDALKLDEVTVLAIQAKPVYTGQMFHFHENLGVTATGTIRLSAQEQGVSAAGLAEVCGDGCINPEGHRGALTAVIQESAREPFDCIFEVGAGYTGRPKCQGRLFLVVNDDEYRDNAGSFSVQFETSPLLRGNACRKECLRAQAETTRACKDACDPQQGDPVGYCDCMEACEQSAATTFTTCMAANCSADPDLPADCRQLCSQVEQAALQACLTDCPPPGVCPPEDPDCFAPCDHVSCATECVSDFHQAVGACIADTCGVDARPQECAVVSIGAFLGCLGDYAPESCPHWGDCEPVQADQIDECTLEYFPSPY